MKVNGKEMYRCPCCDEMKSYRNKAYAPWDERYVGDHPDSITYTICTKCDQIMKKCNIPSVLKFHEFYDKPEGALQ